MQEVVDLVLDRIRKLADACSGLQVPLSLVDCPTQLASSFGICICHLSVFHDKYQELMPAQDSRFCHQSHVLLVFVVLVFVVIVFVAIIVLVFVVDWTGSGSSPMPALDSTFHHKKFKKIKNIQIKKTQKNC